MQVGDVIPAGRVVDVFSGPAPEVDSEVFLVSDVGNFWAQELGDGSFRLTREA